MLTARELKSLLNAHGLRLRKRLGQHYLVDRSLVARVIARCALSPDDQVIEIGAGLGALTTSLAAAGKRVIAVEVDRAIGELLRAQVAAYPNVEVRVEDILRFPWPAYHGWRVVGMIPYQITSAILEALCEQASILADVHLGVQREVARRVAAAPGTKAYGRLSVFVQYHFEARSALAIPRQAFFPVPAVDSAWLHLRPRQVPPVAVSDETLFFRVVQAAFAQRRKTLVNGLQTLQSPTLTRAQAVRILHQLAWPERIRGETLTLAQFAQLADAMQHMQKRV